MLLYADEDFPLPAVQELRRLGHDVLTAQQDGRTATPDPDVLARAHSLGRAVLTYNRRHYERLHRQGAAHSGILSASQDTNHPALAARIHAALAGLLPGRWVCASTGLRRPEPQSAPIWPSGRIGGRIRAMRREAGPTPAAPAEKVGLPREIAADLETGKTESPSDLTERVAVALRRRLRDFAE